MAERPFLGEFVPKVYEGEVANPLDEGRKVTVRGFTFVVPELVFFDRERLEDEGVFEITEEAAELAEKIKANANRDGVVDELRKRQRAHMRKHMNAMAQIAHAAMSRNYPGLSIEHVKREFSYSKLLEAYAAAIGFELRKGSASPAAGEGASSSEQTG